MLRNHFIKSSTGGQPNYTIYYTADLQVPFIGGLQKRGLTMWETGYESKPLATFEVVKDSFADGYGEWGIKTSNPSCFYGLIKDKNGYEYSMDSDNFHTITGLVFPDYDYDYNYITSIGGPLLGGGEGNSLTDVTLPYNLMHIGDSTFKGSTLLQTITIPEYVESLGNYAFLNCSSLQSITIPQYVTSIGKDCFKGCTNLTEVTITAFLPPVLNAENIFDELQDTQPLSINTYCARYYKQSNDWEKYANFIKQDSKTIWYKGPRTYPRYLFVGQSYSSTYYDDELQIGVLKYPNDVTQIGSYMNKTWSSGITEVILPDTITYIGYEAFKYDTDLVTLNIPESVTSISSNALNRLTKLTTLYWDAIACTSISYDSLPGSCILTIIFGPKVEIVPLYVGSDASIITLLFPNTVTTIQGNCFMDCTSLDSITFGLNLKSIGGLSFKGCSSLSTLIFPDGLESIGANAFENCTNLTTVEFGTKLTTLSNYAFNNCTKVRNVTIPVTFIGDLFSKCSLRTARNITVLANSVEEFCNNIHALQPWLSPGSTTNNIYSAKINGLFVSDLIIPNSISEIKESSFEYFKSLTSVVIPSSVTSIGNNAFYNCSSLTKTNYTGDIVGWCDIKFGGGSANPMSCSHNFYINDQEIKDLIIPNNITSIGDYAFYGCSSLTSVTIPASVTSIGEEAFHNCSGLTSVTIPNSVTSIGSSAFKECSSLTSPVYNAHCFAYIPTSYSGEYTIPEGIEQIAGGAFYGCSSLTSIAIPESVTSIGYAAFRGCTGLTSITIPNSVTEIGSGVFQGCKSLTSITIPEGVTSIGSSAFQTCSSLDSITIPNSVTSIGNMAFNSCYALTSITFNGTKAQWGEIKLGMSWKSSATKVVHCTDGDVTL